MKKRKVLEELVIIFWLFVLGSVLGYIFEMIVVLFQKGHFESRQGLIYGPFTPVYGIGIVVYYLFLSNVKVKSKSKVFFITMIFGGIVEYICSLVQEKVFGTISWDYSHLWFNINGRTSLLHCTYWGTAGVLYVTYIGPMIDSFRQKINMNNRKIVTVLVSVFMVFDICISCVAANRQTERRNNISPDSRLDFFLDKYYSDEYMDKVYANKKEVDRRP